jgi:cell wall-associated NlpC family hydrolase
MALVVVTPALEPAVEQAAAAVPVNPDLVRKMEPARPENVALAADSAFAARATLAQRASRADIQRVSRARVQRATRAQTWRTDAIPPTTSRRTAKNRPEKSTRAVKSIIRTTGHQDTRANRRDSATTRSVRHRQVRSSRRTVVHTPRITRRATTQRNPKVMRLGSMTAVIAYAKSQVGARYVSGGEGRGGFDCSGLTRQAYAKAGIRLPHSSGAQAARARRISRGQARPGDLVVGRGHVGIYMGNNMMIDAGNHRTGVVYRKLYSGLSVERL